MKKLPVLALISAVVVAGVLVFCLLRAGSNAPSETASVATAPAAEALAREDGARARPLEAEGAHELDAAGEARGGAAKDADGNATWDPDKSVWVTGTVRTMCADDGPLEVFALSGEADSEVVLRAATRSKKDLDFAYPKVNVLAAWAVRVGLPVPLTPNLKARRKSFLPR